MTSRAPVETCVLNDDAPWNEFDPSAYLDQNYRDLLDVDAEILSLVRDHFSDHFSARTDHVERPILGIDIGAGANLYPALAMLPWCDRITLFERAPRNVGYLRQQRDSLDPDWDAFWKVLSERDPYADIDGERNERFRKTVRVQKGNLFKLGRRGLLGLRNTQGKWQMGTMFFVAESISTSHDEFREAIECFMLSLAPGAPFAAAFMEGSHGYDVGNRHFPACDVDEAEVRKSLDEFTGEIETKRLGEVSHMVRPGHTGIILAYGKRNQGPRS
ncbi:SCO2525 family SAM-dependent methyltransferase [Streptomyces cylindrosporus]|uniref:SCO2525 family SAM-dependent methyltransferase n=1 Tax=Streptomyces cylindrosporus TaxID=2927583 RepID=A0ABS9XYD1_9ACTN|nr:SCO2525 family SAM-dependent methyltransferase [Streptomyces cylindrosporus]MCI3269789.1 SCO2525 family SAM-dependent methyltransferase [Streptomyces cylindrosporus]